MNTQIFNPKGDIILTTEINKTRPLSELKDKIQDILGIPIEDQSITFGGLLISENLTPFDYGVVGNFRVTLDIQDFSFSNPHAESMPIDPKPQESLECRK